MFIFDYFWSFFAFLFGGFTKPGKILFLGLNNAGKTTLLKVLKTDKLGSYEPTIHPNTDELQIGNVTLTAIDLGGHDFGRKIWENYYTNDISAIVFLVDSADEKSFDTAREELGRVMETEILQNVPILILGNKIDKRSAVSEDNLVHSLGLYGKLTGKKEKSTKRPVELFMCSIISQMGYGDGFRWLSTYL